MLRGLACRGARRPLRQLVHAAIVCWLIEGTLRSERYSVSLCNGGSLPTRSRLCRPTQSFKPRWHLASPGRIRNVALCAKDSIDVEELLMTLQRPGGVDALQRVSRKFFEDEERAAAGNATLQELTAASENSKSSDPFAKLLGDPGAALSTLQKSSPEELKSIIEESSLFQKLQRLGRDVLEQMRIERLEVGVPVEISGLTSAPELNGLVGVLVEPTLLEAEEHPDRRIVELEGGGGRIAVQVKNLVIPEHRPGDAVVLNVEFQRGGEQEGMEGRAAVVSTLTKEEIDLGFTDKYRVVVDVLSLLPGGPVTERLLMWPEHLRPRQFEAGDGVELTGLEADASLNGASGTVESSVGYGTVNVVLDGDGRRLEVKRQNLRLVSVALPEGRSLR
eukprot:TRINITY_DN51411_c0_g1_i1.p1 TRINITY_DN51411_c0_g1~~TRINITY_DN51411_c0_g1_i1.p1  ORF type:complete len:406 (-),score=77.59 TRINITY_DN51411_c0_g1_i1:36-1208(-)